MKNNKKLGIWMDNSSADIIEYPLNDDNITVDSKFTHQIKQSALNRNENVMHNKEQDMQASYYKDLAAIMINYSDIIVFGPTTAKSELMNVLKKDHHFDDINISIHQMDKMTNAEKFAFVKKYYDENN